MTDIEEIIIYDTMVMIQRAAGVFCELANRDGTARVREAYKSGLYAPVIRLSVILGPEALERGKARHAEIQRKADEFFAHAHPTQQKP